MSDSIILRTVQDRAQCLACFAVMRELRPHLPDADTFVAQVQRQASQGYRLLAAWRGDQVVGLAGYRLQENTLYGRFVYIDDLIVLPSEQRGGVGCLLIDAVRREAIAGGYTHLVLDTALGNAFGQRFYYRQGLLARGMHFVEALPQVAA
ncbi:GNAT family N-acetyltransferase [Phytopseudomonas punonensis]|uniref:Acetyltransferase (GNAT) family protein n=1 Tax=Phytopseudomonas punonensis TaxID=1220495 RepID=A0A1M7KZ36_9GAMM|nr:GNAT family N-acetyltransferase [Pseudomonas punonensis]SHM70831.1 Acetyltransferase (GNAT) family protein [Pseudomonas punonensis]